MSSARRKKLRRFIGQTVYFTNRDSSSRQLLQQGIRSGIVLSVMRESGGGVVFEIDFGGAGNPKISLFHRRAFTFQVPKAVLDEPSHKLKDKEGDEG